MYGFIICDDISMIEIRGGEKASLKLLNFGNPFGTLKNTLVYIYSIIFYISMIYVGHLLIY